MRDAQQQKKQGNQNLPFAVGTYRPDLETFKLRYETCKLNFFKKEKALFFADSPRLHFYPADLVKAEI